MRQLYEVDVPSETLTNSVPPTCPALWRYRTQVTLDHFSHTFQQEVLSTDSARSKVLAEFLRQVNQLKLQSVVTYVSCLMHGKGVELNSNLISVHCVQSIM